MSDIERAKALLQEGHTSALVRGEAERCSDRRGIDPLLRLWEENAFAGFSVADRVVGKAAAMLYVLLGVREVYADVLSAAGEAVLCESGIPYSCRARVPYIVNRAGDGMCPMEQAVAPLSSPQDAPAVLRDALRRLRAQSK